jgi:hypothetical protein
MSLFAPRGETWDGVCVLVGGFCRVGWEQQLEDMFAGSLRFAEV